MSPSRSFCTCCQFWGKDKKREGAYSEDLEAGGIADQVVAMPVRLESKDIPKLYKTTELGVLDEVHLQNKEDLRRGSDAFITARTARQDIVEDYRSMEQLVREIRQEHGFQETPRSNKDDKEGNCQSQALKPLNMKLSQSSLNMSEANSSLSITTSHSPSSGYHSGSESVVTTPSQFSPAHNNNNNDKGYETMEEISLKEVQLAPLPDPAIMMTRETTLYGKLTHIPHNIYFLISVMYFWIISTTFSLFKKVRT